MMIKHVYCTLLFAFLFLSNNLQISAQCENETMYPVFPLIAPTVYDTIIIGNPTYAGDYAQVNGLIHEKAYTFTSDSIDDFITIRTLDNNEVLAYGIQPLTYIAQNNTSITVHFNTDQCGIENTPRKTTVIGVLSPLDTVYRVGVGVSDPSATLDINGKMRLSDDATFAKEGMMRYDEERKEFQGFDGERWVSLMAGKPNWGTALLPSRESDETLSTFPPNSSYYGHFGEDIGTFENYSILTNKYYLFGGRIIIYNLDETTGKIAIHQVLERQDGFSTAHNIGTGGIDVHDDTFIVGCYKESDNPLTTSGYVYTVVLQDGMWEVKDTISNPTENPNHKFGINVAIYNDLALVEKEIGEDSLVIDVFNKVGENWDHIHTIPQDFSSSGIRNKLLVHEEYLVVGYPGAGNSTQGKVEVYSYDAATNSVNSITTLEAEFPSSKDKFGFDIKMDQNILAVSNPSDTLSPKGEVLLYQVEPDTVIYLQTIKEKKSQPYSQFGYALDFKDDHLIITAPTNTFTEYPDGKTYVYQKYNNEWELVSKLGMDDEEFYYPTSYGFSVGYTPHYLLVGLPHQGLPNKAGRVVVYYKN
ncbi:MAG: hypothetical protein P1U56_26875 [Saprospiraceae bacterium]|nr:hypothetical protein [Saprospiraceae bacterium]